MRHRFVVSATLLAAFVACVASSARADILIAVDKARQQMTVVVDGKMRWQWPVSTGRPGYATPTGAFRPNHLAKRHFSREWDYAPMPHSIFFTHRGHAIHGSPETRRLGTTASHGCVRLALDNAAKLFELVQERGRKRTTVVILGEAPEMTATADSARPARPAREPYDDAIAAARRAYTAPYGEVAGLRADDATADQPARDSFSPPASGSLPPSISN